MQVRVAIFALSLGLTTAGWFLPERSLYTLLEPQVFPTVTKGTLPNHQVWRPARVTTVVPQDYIYLHSLKAAAWGSGFQST